MRKTACSQNIQVKLITLRCGLKEGNFRRKWFSSIAAANEQNLKTLPNEDAQSQALVAGKSSSELSKA